MTRRIVIAFVGCLALISSVAGDGRDPQQPGRVAQAITSSAAPQTAAAPSTASPERALLNRYCVGCHNEKLKTGGLALDALDLSNVSAHAESWEKVVRKLRGGVMPPAGLPRPDSVTYGNFIVWLETELDRAAAAKPNPGRTEALHRLNRA